MYTFVHSCPFFFYKSAQIPRLLVTAGEKEPATKGGATGKLQFVEPIEAWGAAKPLSYMNSGYCLELPFHICSTQQEIDYVRHALTY